jgi:hypothetical protein
MLYSESFGITLRKAQAEIGKFKLDFAWKIGFVFFASALFSGEPRKMEVYAKGIAPL